MLKLIKIFFVKLYAKMLAGSPPKKLFFGEKVRPILVGQPPGGAMLWLVGLRNKSTSRPFFDCFLPIHPFLHALRGGGGKSPGDFSWKGLSCGYAFLEM